MLLLFLFVGITDVAALVAIATLGAVASAAAASLATFATGTAAVVVLLLLALKARTNDNGMSFKMIESLWPYLVFSHFSTTCDLPQQKSTSPSHKQNVHDSRMSV